MRAKISDKNKYYISAHRFYELKHFCLQYPTWKKAVAALKNWDINSASLIKVTKDKYLSDPTAKKAEAIAHFTELMELVEQSASEADADIYKYIIKGVTEGVAYDYMDIPCSRNTYYDRYRKFFWILSRKRN